MAVHSSATNRGRTMSLSVGWDAIFKKDEKLNSNNHPGYKLQEQHKEKYITKSSYCGQWNDLGMSGEGEYIFSHGAQYDGDFFNNMFEGEGMISYPHHQKIEGTWHKDKILTAKYFFADLLEYETPWLYCTSSDRRYFPETSYGLNPVCSEFLTCQHEPRKIPEGCYDTGDGFFNPKTKTVLNPTDGTILRIVHPTEEKWIIENCRYYKEESVGYNPNLYERWCTGKRSTEELILLTEDELTILNYLKEIECAGENEQDLHEDSKLKKLSLLLINEK